MVTKPENSFTPTLNILAPQFAIPRLEIKYSGLVKLQTTFEDVPEEDSKLIFTVFPIPTPVNSRYRLTFIS